MLNSVVFVLQVGNIVLVKCRALSRGKAMLRELSRTQKKNKNQSQVVPMSKTEEVDEARTWGGR